MGVRLVKSLNIIAAVFAIGLLAAGCSPVPFNETPLPDGQKMDTVAIGGFNIGVYEVTYELWYNVRVWAEAHGYYFQNKGWEGINNTAGGKPSANGKNMPVSGISWRDAIVWCNAYSEMSDPTHTILKPVYRYKDIAVRYVIGQEPGGINPDYRGTYPVPAELPLIARLDDFADVESTGTPPGSGSEWKYNGSAWFDTGSPVGTTPHTVDNVPPDSFGVKHPKGLYFWHEFYFPKDPAHFPPLNPDDEYAILRTSGEGRLENGKYISLTHAIELCNRVEIDPTANGYRLPTESQWMSAAGSPYAGYNGSSGDLPDFAWFRDTTRPEDRHNPDYGIHAVGTMPKGSILPDPVNGLGLYDMSGNVWEWCWDAEPVQTLKPANAVYPTLPSPLPQPPEDTPLWYSQNLSPQPVLAIQVMQERTASVMKGGSWFSNAADCETASRALGDALRMGSDTGFRIIH